MAIVTFTSDFGTRDYYIAVIKGAMLCKNAELNIIDITHDINTYDIVQAAFLVGNAYDSFPLGTIHLISVNNFYDDEVVFLAIHHKGHYFIGPNNGVFSLIFKDEIPTQLYALPYDKTAKFPLKELFANTVAKISDGVPLSDFATPYKDFVQKISLQPVILPNRIRGAVVHIDSYENVILNISEDLFIKTGNNRSFSLYFKRNDPITKLSKNYSDVEVGEPLCLFNSAGFLEIAINLGKAAGLLGLKVDDTIQIDFE